MRIKFDWRRPFAFVLASLLLALTLVPSGAAYGATITPMASNESFTSSAGGSSPFNIDTSWRHWRSDGAQAYCRQKGLNNPDGTVGSYLINQWEPGEESKIAALFANADAIAAQYGITGDDKRALIQMVIWAVESEYDSVNPSPSSVSSSSQNMMNAFWALYNAAQAGYTQQTASIGGMTDGGKIEAVAYNDAYVRYGSFSASGGSASASASNAPAGSFFGNGSGNAIDKDHISGQFYFYIPASANTSSNVKITIRATYSTVTVTKYNGFAGYQDQLVGGDPGSGEISATATLLKYGKASVWKQDDRDASAALEGASFKVERWSNSSNSWKSSGVSISWNAASKRYETGLLIVTEDNEGKFRIVETASPPHYFEPDWSKEITIGSYGALFDLSVKNKHYRNGYVIIKKADSEVSRAGLSGAAFKVQQWNGAAYEDTAYKITWNAASRTYESELLWENETNGGKFRVVETKAPYSYNGSYTHDFQLEYNGSKAPYTITLQDTAPNAPTYLTAGLEKRDRNTNTPVPQGDATLAGAKYGIYMAEDREHPDGTVFKKDQLVQTQTTDAAGKATFTKLFPANYYVKEIAPPSAPEGYLLDTNVYPVNGAAAETNPVNITRNVVVTEQVKKQKFELVKIGTSEAETEVTLLNAGFKVYLISELTKVKDGSLAPSGGEWSYKDFKGYDFSGEKTAMIDGVRTPEFFSDSLGHFVSPEFPYGKYIVVESTTPQGYLTINPFIVTVTDDSRTAQPWRIFDDKEMRYYIRVVKKDAETGNVVLGKTAKYRIFDLDAGEYVKMKSTYPQVVWHGTEDNPFATDETGMLITPEKLKYGRYRLDEVVAPEGYVLAGHEQTAREGYDPDGHTTPNPSEPVYVEFVNNTPVYLADAEDDVLEVVQYNEQQKGKIGIVKHGDTPQSVTYDKDGNMLFGYEDEPLEGVVFHVIADGDVLSQDGSGAVVYKDGETVAEIVTDKDGHAWLDGIPIGDYILREVDAPDGYLFVEDEHFSITKLEQTEQFSFIAWDLTDLRQKLDIEITKAEEVSLFPLKGAEFSLYAAEEIAFGDPESGGEGFFSGIASAISGNKPFGVIAKDALVAVAATGEDGKAVFADLPPGRYYAKETKAPEGFKIDEEWTAEFTLAYDGHEKEAVTFAADCEDKVYGYAEIVKTGERFKGYKQNVFSGGGSFTFEAAPLAGVVFEVRGADGMVIEEITTDAKGYAKTSDLPIGKYTLHEKAAPYGYLPVKDVAFEVKPRNGEQSQNFFRFELDDARRKIDIEVTKQDQSDGMPLAGAVFSLVAKTDIVVAPDRGDGKSVIIKAGTEVMKAETGADGKAVFADVPVGAYVVKETKAPSGYYLNEQFAAGFTAYYDGHGSERTVFRAICTDKKIPAPASVTVPKTGDDANPLLWAAVAAAGAIAAIASAVMMRRKKDEDDEEECA